MNEKNLKELNRQIDKEVEYWQEISRYSRHPKEAFEDVVKKE